MSERTASTDPTTCGCCDTGVEEPVHENRPGQSAIDYRVGTHATFLRRMLARLATAALPDGEHKGQRPLAALTTRATTDPAIALLDAWAAVADVLTFYQERIANEGFLRTATERRSVLYLARAIGYTLNPGVAASTYLAFTVDESNSTPDTATIRASTQVQSIPAKEGELPQTFETAEEFTARVAWNALKPRLTEAHPIEAGTLDAYLDSVTTQLQPGDAILFVGDERDKWSGSERWDLRFIKQVKVNYDEGYTYVTWQTELGHDSPTVDPADNPHCYVFRQRARLFGYNAPDWRIMPESVRILYDSDKSQVSEWPDFEIKTAEERRIHLETTYPKIVPYSWVVLTRPGYTELYKVEEAENDSRKDYSLTGQVTRLVLDTNEHLTWFGLRQTAIYGQSEELTLVEKPRCAPVADGAIELDGLVSGLTKDQPIMISGKRDKDAKDITSEVALIDYTVDNGNYTTLILQEKLTNSYVRSTVTIFANVVPATHGETVAAEVLGSGDGAQANQQFTLKQSPLTYTTAATASGAESTLQVRVNDVQWRAATSLYAKQPTDPLYLVQIADNGTASVIFGDGQSGARLPTGQENIKASYRFGIGSDGEVGANALTLLKKRPFGVRSVTNPVAAGGAADPEKLAKARTNAPLTVLTLDRIVSLRDFEDFARAFTGIGKAQAIALWDGAIWFVHLTVADDNGDPVGKELRGKLADAIDDARDPSIPVRIDSYTPLTFKLAATVWYDQQYLPAKVEAAVIDALEQVFAFEQRSFAQPVTAAAVVSTIHTVAGVIAVDLNALYSLDEEEKPVTGSATDEDPPTVLPALPARMEDDEPQPGQLLVIHEDGISLTMLSQTETSS